MYNLINNINNIFFRTVTFSTKKIYLNDLPYIITLLGSGYSPLKIKDLLTYTLLTAKIVNVDSQQQVSTYYRNVV